MLSVHPNTLGIDVPENLRTAHQVRVRVRIRVKVRLTLVGLDIGWVGEPLSPLP